MFVQSSSSNTTKPFVLGGMAMTKSNCIIKTNGARSTALAPFTVMAKVAATGKIVPLTDVTAVDGTAYPCGIYVGPSVTAASIVAGDVPNCPVIVGGSGLIVDSAQLVFENSLTLSTVSAASLGTSDSVYDTATIGDRIAALGIWTEALESVTV